MAEFRDFPNETFMPSEPEVLDARQGFSDAQAALAGAVVETLPTAYDCGWYGSSVSRERGSFALVNRNGLLTDFIGDRLKLTRSGGLYDPDRSVYVYCFGSEDLEYDIHITRRTFAALELLAVERIAVTVEVVSS